MYQIKRMSEGTKDHEKKEKVPNKSIFRLSGIFHYLRPYAFMYFIGWIFLVLSTSAGLVFPYLMGKLLGTTVNPSSPSMPSGFLDLNNVTNVAIALFVLFGVKLYSLFSELLSLIMLLKIPSGILEMMPFLK